MIQVGSRLRVLSYCDPAVPHNAHQVKAVLPAIARRISIGGKIICSGIWRHRAEEMIRLLEDQQLTYRNQRMLENLITISAVKEA